MSVEKRKFRQRIEEFDQQKQNGMFLDHQISDANILTPMTPSKQTIQEPEDIIYSIPELPHFEQFKYPSFNELDYNKLNGISQLDNASKSALLQIDIFDRSTKNLSDTICQFESFAFECQQISEFSSMIASSSLSQISKLDNTSQQRTNGIFNFFISLYKRLTQ